MKLQLATPPLKHQDNYLNSKSEPLKVNEVGVPATDTCGENDGRSMIVNRGWPNDTQFSLNPM